MLRKRVYWLGLALLILGLALTACTGGEQAADETPAATVAAETEGEGEGEEAADTPVPEDGGEEAAAGKVCAVLDTGGENDRSFNEFTLKGAREAAEAEGLEFAHIVSESPIGCRPPTNRRRSRARPDRRLRPCSWQRWS